MDKLKNYAEIRFTNAVLIDIFSHYSDNAAMAEFVSADGSVNIRFRIQPPLDPPKSSEQVLSLMFALFESNAESSMGKAYMSHQKEILRETMLRLSHVIDSFSDIKMSIHTSLPVEGDNDKNIESHTEFTLTRSSTTHSETKNK